MIHIHREAYTYRKEETRSIKAPAESYSSVECMPGDVRAHSGCLADRAQEGERRRQACGINYRVTLSFRRRRKNNSCNLICLSEGMAEAEKRTER